MQAPQQHPGGGPGGNSPASKVFYPQHRPALARMIRTLLISRSSGSASLPFRQAQIDGSHRVSDASAGSGVTGRVAASENPGRKETRTAGQDRRWAWSDACSQTLSQTSSWIVSHVAPYVARQARRDTATDACRCDRADAVRDALPDASRQAGQQAHRDALTYAGTYVKLHLTPIPASISSIPTGIAPDAVKRLIDRFDIERGGIPWGVRGQGNQRRVSATDRQRRAGT
jgi:hypothetical protein